MPALLRCVSWLICVLPLAAQEQHVAPAFHLSSFDSTLAARVTRDGTLDSGAGVLSLLVGAKAEPLRADDMRYGADSFSLWLSWTCEIDGAMARFRALAMPTSQQGDVRLHVALQVEIENPTDEDRDVRIRALLAPGGGEGPRPFRSLPFSADSAWALEDGVVTRDGHMALFWVGPEPTISVQPAVQGPDEAVVTAEFSISVPKRQLRLFELHMAGPPTTATVLEDAWRAAALHQDYTTLQERLSWQTVVATSFAGARMADGRLCDVVATSTQFLRSLGSANLKIASLSDRPYGHPPSDAAAEAEIVGVLAEYGFVVQSRDLVRTLVEEADLRAGSLSPERRLAYVHGLARAVRLVPSNDTTAMLAQDIAALVTEPAAVEPYLDPVSVSNDLKDILARGELSGVELPELRWAEPEPGSIAALMLACRKALVATDAPAISASFRELVAATDASGLGSMTPGGESDARFSIGISTLMRDMLFDDHGADLVIGKGLVRDDIPLLDELVTTKFPTRFGQTALNLYFAGRRSLGGVVIHQATVASRRRTLLLPAGTEARALGTCVGGFARMNDGHSIDFEIDPFIGTGLRFNINLAEGARGAMNKP